MLMLFYLELSKFHSSSDIKKYQVLIIPMNHGQGVREFELWIVPPKKSTILYILLFWCLENIIHIMGFTSSKLLGLFGDKEYTWNHHKWCPTYPYMQPPFLSRSTCLEPYRHSLFLTIWLLWSTNWY
jgi:hypothetical protein